MTLQIQAAIEGTASRVFDGLLMVPVAIVGIGLTIAAIYWFFEHGWGSR